MLSFSLDPAAFVSRETIAKVIDATPDAESRLLIALSRFGGLRVPSEALALRWSDVHWEHNRLTIQSIKTEQIFKRADVSPLPRRWHNR